MDCTVSDVLTSAMSLLGDPGAEFTQEIFDDFSTGYAELIDAALKVGAPEIEREVYYTLPANTGVVFPSSLGATDFAEPRQVWERGNVSTMTITGVTDGSPITVTVSGGANPGSANGRVELSNIPNVPPWVNRDWFITATNTPGTFTLNGSISTGVGGPIATSGSVSWSNDGWRKMTLVDDTPAYNSEIPAELLQCWRWDGRAIYFPSPANNQRQLWIQYTADSTPPPTGIIGLFDGREKKFLAQATAAHFAPKRQLPMGPQCAAWAYGESGQADCSGGSLRELIYPLIKQKNSMPRRMGTFRLRRGMLVVV